MYVYFRVRNKPFQMAETPNEFQLKNPPTDGITAAKFGPNSSQFLLCSSWDTSVRLYDVISNHLRMKYNHPAPVLDCCFHVSEFPSIMSYLRVWMGRGGWYSLLFKNYPIIHLIKILGFSFK